MMSVNEGCGAGEIPNFRNVPLSSKDLEVVPSSILGPAHRAGWPCGLVV